MIKNKSLFKNISIFFCLVPMLLLSLFCLIPKNDKFDIYATDQVITNFNFVGSNVFLPVTLYVRGTSGGSARNMMANVEISFGIVDGRYRASVQGYGSAIDMNTYFGLGGLETNVHNIEDAVARSDSFFVGADIDTTYGFDVRVFHSGQLTSDIIKATFSSYQNLTPNTIKPANYYNTITYYDVQGEYIQFEFPMYNLGTLNNNFRFEERTYYFTNSFDDNAFYNLGYADGLDQGLQDGYNNGYQSGLDVGSQSGYEDGFSAGVQSANDYSFIGLFGAVIDAPVSAFTGLLNFEILGFNILSFVTGLITLALIIFIVKLCLGGK